MRDAYIFTVLEINKNIAYKWIYTVYTVYTWITVSMSTNDLVLHCIGCNAKSREDLGP
jgi:hypothetical protein